MADYYKVLAKIDELFETLEALEDIPAAEEFHDSVREKAIGIQETIKRNHRATDNQANAIDNMLAGALKWKPD